MTSISKRPVRREAQVVRRKTSSGKREMGLETTFYAQRLPFHELLRKQTPCDLRLTTYGVLKGLEVRSLALRMQHQRRLASRVILLMNLLQPFPGHMGIDLGGRDIHV